jgi:hypothetical protein
MGYEEIDAIDGLLIGADISCIWWDLFHVSVLLWVVGWRQSLRLECCFLMPQVHFNI